jgi:hypothetical protein
MRRLGVAVLGLFVGLLASFLLIEVVASISLGADGLMPDSLPLALLLGFLTPVLVVVGVVVALVIDGRLRHRSRTRTRLEDAVSLLVLLQGGDRT